MNSVFKVSLWVNYIRIGGSYSDLPKTGSGIGFAVRYEF